MGFGFSWGYLITAFLMRFDSVKSYSVGSYRNILLIPISLSLLISLIIYYTFEFTNYGESLRDFLSLALVIIFILWQFAQAWWMRVPFKEFALKKMINVKGTTRSNFGRNMNAVSPFFWALIGFCIFSILESQGAIFSIIFKIAWLVILIILLTFLIWTSTFFIQVPVHNNISRKRVDNQIVFLIKLIDFVFEKILSNFLVIIKSTSRLFKKFNF